jgi:dTDP-4-dehydrorhamnose reductase
LAELLARPLVIGSSGQLGSELVKIFSDCDVVGLDHAAIEIEDARSVDAALARFRPTLVLNTAAFYNVDECERRPQRAFAVNAIAVDYLAGATARIGASFATISTDFVFSGTRHEPYLEDDVAEPLNVYGISKRTSELCALRHSARNFVIRTSGLYGSRVPTQKELFLDRIFRQVANGETPRVVTDVVSTPSYAPDVAAGIRSVVERNAFGIVHVTNSGGCSWFEFAQEALRLAGLPATITPVSYREFNPIVPRPSYTVLALGVLDRLGMKMPAWQDALRRYVAARLTLTS